jgi:hypothetical protein
VPGRDLLSLLLRSPVAASLLTSCFSSRLSPDIRSIRALLQAQPNHQREHGSSKRTSLVFCWWIFGSVARQLLPVNNATTLLCPISAGGLVAIANSLCPLILPSPQCAHPPPDAEGARISAESRASAREREREKREQPVYLWKLGSLCLCEVCVTAATLSLAIRWTQQHGSGYRCQRVRCHRSYCSNGDRTGSIQQCKQQQCSQTKACRLQ